MRESLLSVVLTRLDQLASPVYLHAELARFPPKDLASLISLGILQPSLTDDEIPRPARFPGGGYIAVQRTTKGIFGCPCEGAPYFDPIPLTDDDVRQYEVSLAMLGDRIRRENQIDGSGHSNHGGLVPLGQKALPGSATVDVYLSLPNADERDVLTRCQRLSRSSGGQPVVFVTPRGVALSPEGRRVLDGTRVILAPLIGGSATVSLSVDWDGVLGGLGAAAGASAEEPCLGLTPTDVAVIRAYQEWDARRVRRNGLPVAPTLVHVMEQTDLARATVIESRKRLMSERFLEQIPNARPGALRLTLRGLKLRPPPKA